MVLALHLKQKDQYPPLRGSTCLLEQQFSPIVAVTRSLGRTGLHGFRINVLHMAYTLYHPPDIKTNYTYPAMRMLKQDIPGL